MGGWERSRSFANDLSLVGGRSDSCSSSFTLFKKCSLVVFLFGLNFLNWFCIYGL